MPETSTMGNPSIPGIQTVNKTEYKKWLPAAIILVLVAVIVGGIYFSSKGSVAGVYISQKNPSHYRELKDDGTAREHSSSGTDTYVTYSVQGDVITFLTSYGSGYTSKKQGQNIVDSDGEIFIKR
ncbi:MAG: hypothetical protein ACYC0L_04795 [Thermoleophilia bacterium]